jgi:hypothetical protein
MRKDICLKSAVVLRMLFGARMNTVSIASSGGTDDESKVYERQADQIQFDSPAVLTIAAV